VVPGRPVRVCHWRRGLHLAYR